MALQQLVQDAFHQKSSGLAPVSCRLKSLEVEIVNCLQHHRLSYHKVYFDSGAWYEQKITVIPPIAKAHATVSSRKYAFTGVSVGMTMKIGKTGKFLVLGFTNPLIGRNKTWISVSHDDDPKVGYTEAKNDHLKYEERDDYTLKATIETSTVAQRKMVFFISDLPEDEFNKVLENTQSAQTDVVDDPGSSASTVESEGTVTKRESTQKQDRRTPCYSCSKILTGAATLVIGCVIQIWPEIRRMVYSEMRGVAVWMFNTTKED